jgi:hypothetical protein
LGFAALSGVYLAKVRVAISDVNGSPVAELIAEGPWLQVTLAPGVYNIIASYDGRAHELRDLRLNNGDTTTHVLYWDVNILPVEMLAQGPSLKTI